MIIATSSISKWRVIAAKGFKLVDITVKSGIKEVAPNWDFLMEYKASDHGPVAEAEYTRYYTQKLDHLERTQPDFLLTLLEDKACYCCYCGTGKFCHRHLLLPRLFRVATENKIPLIYIGEIV